jgi:hypothetical protein|tara:strand:+ start:110 stop:703 length:594 start_codon:yes stop_codon:yes gene_type:complete
MSVFKVVKKKIDNKIFYGILVIMKKKNHYIDNKEFFEAMCVWKEELQEAENQGDAKPPISNYIGSCFIKIAEHLATKPNFTNYPYKDEMINDSIENCLMYAHNFDPEKSKNPFSYFTQIIYYAFLRRIEKEKKQNYIKFKLAEMKDDGSMGSWFKENYFEKDNVKTAMREHFNLSEDDVTRMTPKSKSKKGSTGPFK